MTVTRRGELIADWLAYYANREPDRLAAVDLFSGRRFSYAAFNQRATRLAALLQQHYRVQVGDRVALMAGNSVDHFALLFACWKIGAVFMPVNWRLSQTELQVIWADAEPALIIADREYADRLGEPSQPLLWRYPEALADCPFEQALASSNESLQPVTLDLDSMNTLLYTSGTTGQPKGVIGNYRMTQTIVLQSAAGGFVDRNTVCLTFAPLFHTAGLNSFALPLFHCGGTLCVMRQWDPQACLNYLKDPALGVTHTLGVPYHLTVLSQLPDFADARFPALQVVGVGGAPATGELLQRWHEKGVPLSQSYGMTEVFGLGFQPPAAARANPKAAGKPLLYSELQIGDEQGQALPAGSVGEIQVRGPGVTPGYWRQPELTAAAYVNDWFRTGDAGMMEADGTFYVVDRFKDMYISGGENVYPIEVENVIARLPGVAAVAVVGVPDPVWQETGLALLVLRPDATIDPLAVRDYCRQQLAHYKVPAYIVAVDGLPLSAQGKVLKRQLRQQYRDPQQLAALLQGETE